MGVLQIFSFLLLIARATVAFPLEGADSTVVPVLRPPDAGGDAKYPIESAAPEDVAPAPSDSAPTDFPILTPSDEDFEVLRPVPAEEEPPTDASNVQADNNSDAAIERPYPALEKLGMERLELGTERFRRSASGNDGDDEPVVIESAGNETGDDDTVTVNAASCGELLSSCKGKVELLSRIPSIF